jgi:glycosyltransferase involved in cell wall biosynthesis
MRFLFVIPDLSGGGAEKAIINTGTALAKRGNEVHIAVLANRIAYDVNPDLNLHILGSVFGGGWFGKRLLAAQLSKLANAINPQITVSTLPFADEVTALARLPRHVCRIANTLSAEIEQISKVSRTKALRRLNRYQSIYRSRSLITVSQGVASDLKLNLKINSKTSVIANPFDFSEIRRKSAEPIEEAPQDYIIHVARFSPQKRHDLLFDAWAAIKTTLKLVLLTDASRGLVELIHSKGISNRVYIAGFKKNPYPWIANAKVLVLCSDHEGLPNVLIEALICGTPVISTDCPSGPREILADNLPSALIPCNDALSLSNKIKDFLEFPPNLNQLNLDRYNVQFAAGSYEDLARAEP